MFMFLGLFCGFTKKSNGGERGIRTLEGLHLTRVPGVLLQPLGHLPISQKEFNYSKIKSQLRLF